MADTDSAEILNFLRERFNRIDARLDRMAEDIHDLKVRMTAVERGLAECNASIAGAHAAIAGVHSRIDRVDARLERIERRLDLVEVAS